MRRLNKIVWIILIILLFGVCVPVQANTRSLTFTPEPSTTTLEEGEEIIINLNLSDIKMGEEGINTFGGKLVYDEKIFEKVTNSSFSSKNNWSIVYNDEETSKKGTFLATINSGATSNQSIGTLTLKVKKQLKSTSTKIQFTELSSVAEDTVNLTNKTIQLSIVGTVKDQNNTIENVINNTTENVVKNTVDTTNTTNTVVNIVNNKNVVNTVNTVEKTEIQKNDTTISSEKIPQTGIEDTVLVIITGILVVISIIGYIKYRKNGDIN